MASDRPTREFRQRVIDTYDRSRIQEIARSARPRRRDVLRKRYATLVLGASLAVGGIGVPMKMATSLKGERTPGDPKGATMARGIGADLVRAQQIAREVTGGVEAAAGTVALLNPVEEAPQQLKLVTEKVKEDFFKTEVPFGDIIYREARKHDLEPEFVAAVVKTESQFKPNARSPRNAQGLMQLVPRTGKWMGARNLMNPVENVKAGTKYLKYLHERFDGDETKVIAAYNAGEGNVRKFGGIPPFKETRNYVRKVERSTADFKDQIEERVVDHVAETVAEGADSVLPVVAVTAERSSR